MKVRMLTRLGIAALFSILLTVLLQSPAPAAQAAGAGVVNSEVLKWAYLGAAIATAVSSVAAGYAVARVGSAALGALAEKPELFGKIIVLVGLAEGIAIYGLIISILILNQIR